MKLLFLISILASYANAQVTLDVESRTPVLDGKIFGTSGAYERIIGKAHFQLDPKHKPNRAIPDIDHAPVNAQTRVEYTADFYILQPVDASKGNYTLLFEVSNRGGKGMLGMFNRAAGSTDPRLPQHFGDEMLLREGYTMVWLGWQHDVGKGEGALRLYAPKAIGVSGLVRSEYIPSQKTKRVPLADPGHIPYEVSKPEEIKVTVRETALGERVTLPADQWRFARDSIQLENDTKPGAIYDVIYPSQDPPIPMTGLAAIRDFISYLRTQRGTQHTIGFGISQSGMLLRAFLYHGFNEDLHGKRVFDGVFSQIAGGRRSVLQRFAQPSRTTAPLRALLYGTDSFPFADAALKDPETNLTDGVLAHLKPSTIPKIFYCNSSYEYWGSSASLLHSTLDGMKDVAPPASTRIYMFAGGQHGPAAFPPSRGQGQNWQNPNDYRWSARALLPAMQQWVATGKTPPRSRYPMIANSTSVAAEKLKVPEGLNFPKSAYTSYRISNSMPPVAEKPYVSLVPQIDEDGNDIAGIRMPDVEVPLATYTGWNFRAVAAGQPDQLQGGGGSFLPFSKEKILARYKDLESYLAQYEMAAKKLASQGYLLEQDIPALRKAAETRWNWIMQSGRITNASPIPARAVQP